eukprot:CAMPEP_0178390450 /NCGR_PEP_ID=MMETSP0689_2-20121128/10653_1 /TAXON_ID=160604 /ORGANISM="Amphidinium massartii, Strain CS-259" /LENGTH=678 /DNA_ID=CAMNT_0020010961 /DNA_START=48 /DNA_END=2081 /DNA_ORIENTATION=-
MGAIHVSIGTLLGAAWIVVAIVLSYYIFILLRQAYYSVKAGRQLELLHEWVKSLLGNDSDEYQRAFTKVLRHTEEIHSRKLVMKSPPFVVGMLILRMIGDDVPGLWDNAAPTKREMYELISGEVGSSWVAIIVISVWSWCPRTCTHGSMSLVACYFFATLRAWLCDDLVQLVGTLDGAALIRLVLSVYLPRTMTTVLVNIGLTGYYIHELLKIPVPPSSPYLPSLDDTDRIFACRREFAALVLILAVSYVLTSRTHLEVRAILKARQAKLSDDSIHGLLTVLCDAEVRLSYDLTTVECSPSLGAMLFIRNGVPEGRAFIDFVHANDQARFKNFMRSAEPIGPVELCDHQVYSGADFAVAPAVHLHLVDVNRCNVDVQIFVGSSLDMLGRVTHHLGICESSQGERIPQVPIGRCSSPAPAKVLTGSTTAPPQSYVFNPILPGFTSTPGARNDHHRAQGPDWNDRGERRKETWGSMASSSWSTPVSPANGSSTRVQYEVYINPLSPTLAVSMCTTAFAARVGRGGNIARWGLADVLDRHAVADFTSKLQEVVQEALYDAAVTADGDLAGEAAGVSNKSLLTELGCFTFCANNADLAACGASAFKAECVADCSTLAACTEAMLLLPDTTSDAEQDPEKLALHGEADHAHLLCGSSCSTSALWTSVVVIPQDHEGMYVLEEV